ncbi:DUF4385 domain-containing protein [Crenothrix sp.]|uniref:DUF4385 domain-containing protein n=1 Tax=Crenothrix sp. TaxID=3100433 RepID=UPI00374C8ACD
MSNLKTQYAAAYRAIDFRKYPELYPVGKGEQGVLMAEPYKSEILPFWRFKTLAMAQQSAEKIYALFLAYKQTNEFVGMDMARKYLMMGWTRSRRYANHPSGRKYNPDKSVKKQADDALTSEKAQAAAIFFAYYQKAKTDQDYLQMLKEHVILYKNYCSRHDSKAVHLKDY